MRIYITRHGETVWNTEARFQGSKDSPLTEKGIRSAKNLGKKVESIAFDSILSSPLQRAKDTAELIRGNRDIPLCFDIRLREMEMGPWEGLTVDEIRREYGTMLDMYWDDFHNFYLPGAEPFETLYSRCKSFAEDLKKMKEKTVLLVSHGMTLAFLLETLRGTKFSEIKTPVHILKGTSLSLFEYRGGDFQERYIEKDLR